MNRFCIVVCWIILPVVTCGSALAQSNKWPRVQSFSEKRVFIDPGKDGTDTPFVALIKDLEGYPLYRLVCHNSNYEDDESEINFSGYFAAKASAT